MATKPRPATPSDGAAWVTGASSGIGRAVALKLARLGWTVAATARSQEKLAEVAAAASGFRGRIVPLAGDTTDAERMTAIVGEIERDHGGLARAVLNAGIYIPVDGEAPRLEDFRSQVDVNLDGTVNCLVPAIAAMRTRQAGQIAIVSSVAGYTGLPKAAAYGMTKAGLINLAESLKFDLDHEGILVQLVCPGFVETPATADNPFEMPFLMKVEDAADRMVDGLAKDRFEVTFPKAFTWQLKLMRALPYWAYFPLIARTTGWNRKKRAAAPAG